MTKNFQHGTDCTINGIGDLMMDREQGAFIGENCIIIKKTKAGLIQVALAYDMKIMTTVPQRNIDINTNIQTLQTNPDDRVVGQFFRGGITNDIYYCDSYDPRIGYWMQSVHKEFDRRNVSERAINRTFHIIHNF